MCVYLLTLACCTALRRDKLLPGAQPDIERQNYRHLRIKGLRKVSSSSELTSSLVCGLRTGKRRTGQGPAFVDKRLLPHTNCTAFSSIYIDSGSTTMRMVIGTAALEISSYTWKVLTATGIVSNQTSERWDERVFFPLSEGFYMLPSVIVISVWMDVTRPSFSRVQVRFDAV